MTSKDVSLGLDISTSIIGLVALENSTGKMIKMEAIKLTGVRYKDVWDKAEEVERRLQNFIDLAQYNVKNIFVEEAHMRFTPGLSSAGTLFSLARFNGIVCFIANKIFRVKPTMINVRSARKTLGIKINHKDKSSDTKTKVFDAVRKINPNFPWVQHMAKTGKSKGLLVWNKENFDIADAWVVVAAGIRFVSSPSFMVGE